MPLYVAGFKDGEVRFDLFSRDLLLSALMTGDPSFLKRVLEFVFRTQGTKNDPQTGEEPGKVIHEYQSVRIGKLNTRYNACDVTQLALIGLQSYIRESGDSDFLIRWKDSIRAALDYIFRHLDDGLFVEDPAYSGAESYALDSTYWKDEQIPRREEPEYPVVYTLVQAQTISALRATVELESRLELDLTKSELQNEVEKSRGKLLNDLWDPEREFPYVAVDGKGEVAGVTSDGLHLLFYLRERDVPEEKLTSIFKASKRLETPYGFRTYAPGQPGYAADKYHLGSIWPFEQYYIARAAEKFGRKAPVDAALGTLDAIREYGFYELFSLSEEGLQPLGCDKQLWTTCLPLGLERLTD